MALCRVPSLRFHESAEPSLRSGIRELALEQLTAPVGGDLCPVEVEKRTCLVGTSPGFDRQDLFPRGYCRIHMYRGKVFRQKREKPFSQLESPPSKLLL